MSSFTNLQTVQPRGSPFLGPDNSHLRGLYDNPIGRGWSGNDLSSLYVDPVGLGDGGGRPDDPMTRELTDAETYISTHYAVSTQPDGSHLMLHKGFPVWILNEMPGSAHDQISYKVLPIYWLNQFLTLNFKLAREKLKNFVLDILLDKYPMVVQDLYKIYQRTQNMALNQKKKRNFNTKDNTLAGRNNGYSDDDNSSHDNDDNDDGDNDSLDESFEETAIHQSGSLLNTEAFLDQLWIEFLYKHMPHEDFFFQEINKDTYWLSTMPPLAKDGRVVTKSPPNNRGDYFIPATSNEESTYENIFEGVIKALNDTNTSNKNSSYGGVSGSVGGSNNHNSGPALPTLGSLTKRTMRFKDAIDKANKLNAQINHSKIASANSSVEALLTHAADMREQKYQAIKEIKEFIYASLNEPKSHLFGSRPNPLPFLFRGGYFDNFNWLGVANTLSDDTVGMHSWGQMTAVHQIVKATLEREQQMYNYWGDKLPLGTKLYWCIRRKPNPNYMTNFYSSSFLDGDDNNGVYQAKIDIGECDGYSNANKPGLCGFYGYEGFEIVPMHWGLKEVDQRSLAYIDVFGKRAIAHLIYVGRVKYDYYSPNGTFPLEERNTALGHPGLNGAIPTKEMCKRATGKLPFITVLIRT